MKHLKQSELKAWRETNTPEVCPILGHKTGKWAVDHCHSSGMVRGVVSMEGNAFMGRAENSHKRLSLAARVLPLPEALRRMAAFLEQPDTGILHPVGLRQLTKRFKNMKVEDQVFALKALGVPVKNIKECKNKIDRADLYKQYLKK